MRVTDNITGQRFGADEAYERFFDGFYNLGKPADVFAGTVVLGPPRREPITPRRRRARRPVKSARRAKR
jgi:hypothetical protein